MELGVKPGALNPKPYKPQALISQALIRWFQQGFSGVWPWGSGEVSVGFRF